MDRKYLPAALLVLTLALSGCTALPGGGDTGDQPDRTGQIKTTPNDGLTISFNSVVSEYYDDEKLHVVGHVQNTGGAKAEDIKYSLVGEAWAVAGTTISDPDPLSPPEPANNVAGGRDDINKNIDITLDLAAGEKVSGQTVGLVTAYNYSSSTRTSITVLPKNEYREQKGSRTQVRNRQSNGPVKVSFQGLTPVRSDEGTVKLTFSEVGNGKVEDTEGDAKLNSVTVKIPSKDDAELCSWSDVRLSRTLYCNLGQDLPNVDNPFKGNSEMSVGLIATAKYRYEERHDARFSVIGTSGN